MSTWHTESVAGLHWINIMNVILENVRLNLKIEKENVDIKRTTTRKLWVLLCDCLYGGWSGHTWTTSIGQLHSPHQCAHSEHYSEQISWHCLEFMCERGFFKAKWFDWPAGLNTQELTSCYITESKLSLLSWNCVPGIGILKLWSETSSSTWIHLARFPQWLCE